MKRKLLPAGIILLRGMIYPLALGMLSAWLFYDLEPPAILLVVSVAYQCVSGVKRERSEYERKISEPFRDMLAFFRNALLAGYSPEHALNTATEGVTGLYGEENRLARELNQTIRQLMTGYSLEDALSGFGERCENADITEFISVFNLSKRTGGNMLEIISQTATILSEKLELEREIHAEIGARETEFKIMCLMPYGILAYLRMFSGEFLSPLYGNPKGYIFMTIIYIFCLMCEYGGRYLIGKSLRA